MVEQNCWVSWSNLENPDRDFYPSFRSKAQESSKISHCLYGSTVKDTFLRTLANGLRSISYKIHRRLKYFLLPEWRYFRSPGALKATHNWDGKDVALTFMNRTPYRNKNVSLGISVGRWPHRTSCCLTRKASTILKPCRR